MKRGKKGRVESELKKEDGISKIKKAASFGGSELLYPTKKDKILSVAQYSKNGKARMHAVTMLSELEKNDQREELLACIVEGGAFEDARAKAAKIIIDMEQVKSEGGKMVLGLRGSGEKAKKAVDELADPNSHIYDLCEDPILLMLSDEEDSDEESLRTKRAIYSAENLITIAKWALRREIAEYAMEKLRGDQFSGEEEADYIMMRVENPARHFIDEEESDGLWDYAVKHPVVPLKEDKLPEYEIMVLDDLKGRANLS